MSSRGVEEFYVLYCSVLWKELSLGMGRVLIATIGVIKRKAAVGRNKNGIGA